MQNVLESSAPRSITRIDGIEVLTPGELADRLGKSVVTVRRWTKAGKLPHLTVGHRSIFYLWAEVVRVLRNNCN